MEKFFVHFSTLLQCLFFVYMNVLPLTTSNFRCKTFVAIHFTEWLWKLVVFALKICARRINRTGTEKFTIYRFIIITATYSLHKFLINACMASTKLIFTFIWDQNITSVFTQNEKATACQLNIYFTVRLCKCVLVKWNCAMKLWVNFWEVFILWNFLA